MIYILPALMYLALIWSPTLLAFAVVGRLFWLVTRAMLAEVPTLIRRILGGTALGMGLVSVCLYTGLGVWPSMGQTAFLFSLFMVALVAARGEFRTYLGRV